MSYFVYILYSNSLGQYYTGSCANFEIRFSEHNKGYSRFTRKGIPWDKIRTIEVESRRDALKLENKIKKRGAMRFLSQA